jgi:hypothetical protein
VTAKGKGIVTRSRAFGGVEKKFLLVGKRTSAVATAAVHKTRPRGGLGYLFLEGWQ